MIKVKRAYEPQLKADGARVLIEREWPANLSKNHSRVTLWMREVAPTQKLHTVLKRDSDWDKFKQNYIDELSDKPELIAHLRELEKRDKVLTLLFSAKDLERNNAAVLREFMLSA